MSDLSGRLSGSQAISGSLSGGSVLRGGLSMGGGNIVIDDELSPISENPVQNKVIYSALLASAAQIETNKQDIVDLKSSLNYVYVPNDITWVLGTLNPGTGAEIASNTRVRSPYIFVNAGDKIKLSTSNNDCLIVYCFSLEKSYIYDTPWSIGNAYTVPETINGTPVRYIRILIRKSNSNPTIASDEIDTLVSQCTINKVIPSSVYNMELTLQDIADIETEVEDIKGEFNVINRFNKATISEGKYINVNTGGLATSEAFFASDFIYIGDLQNVTVSYTHIFGWYDVNKAWLGHPDSMNSGNADLTFDIPENAVYLRFSAYNSNLALAQIGESVSRSAYVPYGKYTLPDLIIATDQIVVDASGGGDYTSLTKALYDNVDSGVDIVVKPGEYNLVTEYVEIFGQSAVDNMADADSAIFNGFQYGAIIRNRKITFETGAHVVCDWTGHTVDGTHRFSALRVDYNCEIIGLDLLSIGTFYAIHDDYGLNVPYTVRYSNCRVEGRNLTNANCIGGGCKKYSRHVIDNCYFNNNLTGSATVRYHNTNAEGAEPEIYVSNTYFNNWFTPRWYGTQTTKMKVYVNNCEARSIHKLAESSSYNVDNVELYKWCNTETNPVS